MRRKVETSDLNRITQLDNLIEHQEITGPHGNRIFEERMITEMIAKRQRIKENMEIRNAILARMRRKRKETNLEKEKLMAMIRNIWHTVLYSVKDERLDETQISLYGLSVTGKRPKRRTSRDWINLAIDIIQGDTRAEASGSQPITNPDRESLAQQTERLQTKQIEYEATRAEQERNKTERDSLRIETIHLIRDAIFAIEKAHRHQNPITKRNLMRVLGFRFGNQAGFEDEPEQEEKAS